MYRNQIELFNRGNKIHFETNKQNHWKLIKLLNWELNRTTYNEYI